MNANIFIRFTYKDDDAFYELKQTNFIPNVITGL